MALPTINVQHLDSTPGWSIRFILNNLVVVAVWHEHWKVRCWAPKVWLCTVLPAVLESFGNNCSGYTWALWLWGPMQFIFSKWMVWHELVAVGSDSRGGCGLFFSVWNGLCQIPPAVNRREWCVSSNHLESLTEKISLSIRYRSHSSRWSWDSD